MIGTAYDQEEEQPPRHHFHPRPAAHMRQLLVSCAELISQSDFASALQVVSLLTSGASPDGDSNDRLVHHFTKALSIRLTRLTSSSSSSSSSSNFTSAEALHSSYLNLNQITPFVRFCHLTANQAILEAMEGRRLIHILDLDTMQGVQWPPFMQALADRSGPTNPPPTIRITGVGDDIDVLRRTGDRLRLFAETLGLDFHFIPLHFHHRRHLHHRLRSSVSLHPDESLAVNCIFSLHKLLSDDSRDLRLFLQSVKSMNPAVVTLAEREGNHNHPIFLERFVEALDHYKAIFESLEATLPPTSPERIIVEEVWFGREIVDIVAGEGEERKERHERYESWVEMMRSCGFSSTPLSPFALSQAKLLLRLHYPSEGYHLHLSNSSFFIGWQNRALFSVSSWQ